MLSDAAPANARYKNALIIFNPKAGSVAAGDDERIAAILTELGVSRTITVGPERVSPRLLSRARHFDVIIVLGGDGTARAVAAHALSDGPPLVLLPGGTLNILPKALYGLRAWPEALRDALTHGVERQLPAGLANGERFFVAAIFGAPTMLARAREAMRKGDVLRAASGVRHYVKRAFARRLRARCNQEGLRKAEAIGVLLPTFGGVTGSRPMEWVRLRAKHFVDMARVSVRALGPGWREDPAVEVNECETGDIAARGVVSATLDGEPRTFISRVRITYDAVGVRVLALGPDVI
jgi:diacylglycerol kinase family enzyme